MGTITIDLVEEGPLDGDQARAEKWEARRVYWSKVRADRGRHDGND